MNRNRWILLALALLLGAGNIVFYVWKSWGLITIHSDDRPLSEIIRSIEKQGHIVVKTDVPPSTPIRMNVDKVPVTEALETLATITEARWRLTYLVAGDVATIQGALSRIVAGERPEGWKTAWMPMPNLGDDEGPAPDPRRDTWEVKAPSESKLQAYLEEASRHVSASFLYPENWNPEVSSAPKPGEITNVVPKLAKVSQSRTQEVFLLTKGRGRGEGRPPEGERGPPREFNPEIMAVRMQAEIDKLPAEKRAVAQAEFEERKQFFTAMRDLSPEERRSKMEDFMSRPEIQDRMEKREMERDARRTPKQRMERAQRYLDRKNQARNGGTSQR